MLLVYNGTKPTTVAPNEGRKGHETVAPNEGRKGHEDKDGHIPAHR